MGGSNFPSFPKKKTGITDDGTTIAITGPEKVAITAGKPIGSATPVSIGGEVKLDGTQSFVNVTGTLPASPSATVYGIDEQITSAGVAAQAQYGHRTTLLAGHTTGNARTAAIYGRNEVRPVLVDATYVTAAIGVRGEAAGGGNNENANAVGVYGYGVNGNVASGIGVLGVGSCSNKAEIGVAGVVNGNADHPLVAGYFLHWGGAGSQESMYIPTVSGAVVADNGGKAIPILNLLDNHGIVFSVEDGGYLTSAQGGTAGLLKWGVPAASPQAYTHGLAANGVGSDIVGAKATLTPGIGTGAGGSGAIAVQTAYPVIGGTATTLNTPLDRISIPSLWSTLTAASADGFATMTFAASAAVSAEFYVLVEANDGTDYQSLSTRIRVSSARAAAGNTVSSISEVGTSTLATTSVGATLTAVFTVTEGAAACTVTCNAVSSLTETTLRLSYQAIANGPVTIAQIV